MYYLMCVQFAKNITYAFIMKNNSEENKLHELNAANKVKILLRAAPNNTGKLSVLLSFFSCLNYESIYINI